MASAPFEPSGDVEQQRQLTRDEHALRQRFIAVHRGTVLRAPRTTAGFDLRLSRKLRADWKSLGAKTPGHICHWGLPVCFVPPGDYHALGAMSAEENIADEVPALLERGARGKQSS
jgi:hypothetical protein